MNPNPNPSFSINPIQLDDIMNKETLIQWFESKSTQIHSEEECEEIVFQQIDEDSQEEVIEQKIQSYLKMIFKRIILKEELELGEKLCDISNNPFKEGFQGTFQG